MRLFSRFKKPQKTANIVVYYLSAIVEGDAFSSPLGCMPRFPPDYEARVRRDHSPHEGAYINEQLHGASVILFWTNDGIDAVSFLSVEEAKKCHDLREFSAADLAVLEQGLTHFPRNHSRGP
jgi:hypothetical protein